MPAPNWHPGFAVKIWCIPPFKCVFLIYGKQAFGSAVVQVYLGIALQPGFLLNQNWVLAGRQGAAQGNVVGGFSGLQPARAVEKLAGVSQVNVVANANDVFRRVFQANGGFGFAGKGLQPAVNREVGGGVFQVNLLAAACKGYNAPDCQPQQYCT